MTNDPATIAKGLTEAQRRVLLDAFVSTRWRTWKANRVLYRLGLLETSTGTAITPLGLAVRAILMEQDNG